MSPSLSKGILVLTATGSCDAFPSHFLYLTAATPAGNPDRGGPDHRGPNG